MKRYLWILLAAPALLGAQSAGGFATPTLGYLFDPDARSLRAIEGVPGAAVLGDALHLGSPFDGGQQFDSISVSSNRRYALATRTADTHLTLIRLDGRSGSAETSRISRGRAFFSPSGNTAAVATADAIEIWTGLPGDPSLLRTIAYSNSLDKAAVSDNGREVAVVSGGTLMLLSDDPRALASGVNDVAFLRGTEDLAVLTSTALQVYRKSDPSSSETLLPLDGALAMAFSRDEASLAVLSSTGITWIELDTQSSATLTVDAPAQLARAEGNAVFSLADAAGNLWLFDGDSTTPRLVAVETRGGQAQ